MPHGRVKWYDADKGFGFVAADDGEEVFLHASTVPAGVEPHAGMRLDFDMIDGRKGKQVLKARVLDDPAPRRKPRRKDPEKVAVMIEDVIKVLDDTSAGLRKGRYPDAGHSHRIASVLRAVADELEN
ncbi:cold-shock protein [Brevibacterium litoralis]|uniref:cold-shock protein n=1 Tax=Brevibacterium litoralis TaxID=3138935 RepID=UPI0032F04854